MSDSKFQKPFLKWLGGKTQIIKHIIAKVPEKINNYHELFLGGGSVLLAILSLQKQKKIHIRNKVYAYDINLSLINSYKCIQSHKDELYTYIQYYRDEYNTIEDTIVIRTPTTVDEAKTSKESYYYWIRNKFNQMDKNTVEASALFIFLNKTCFRGMYREGPNGYNVPYGHYKKTPQILTIQELNDISDLIQNVEFVHCDFSDSIKRVKKGDFVYIDPPYAPETKNSFVGYVADGFTMEMHHTLFDSIKAFKNIKFVMSNSKVDVVMETFPDYTIEEVLARRTINSKKPDSTTTEVLIYN